MFQKSKAKKAAGPVIESNLSASSAVSHLSPRSAMEVKQMPLLRAAFASSSAHFWPS